MLSDERIRELALMAVSPHNYWSPSVDRAIRLAVAETAEACAVLCSDAVDDFGILQSPEGQQAAAYCANEIRTAIREKAREGK